MVIPFALVAGYFRGIPIWWRLIDCSFGIVGLVPLSIVRGLVSELERMQDDDLPVWALKNEC
jgi:hypothetical protein